DDRRVVRGEFLHRAFLATCRCRRACASPARADLFARVPRAEDRAAELEAEPQILSWAQEERPVPRAPRGPNDPAHSCRYSQGIRPEGGFHAHDRSRTLSG